MYLSPFSFTNIIYKINLYNINKVIVEAITEVTIVIISCLVLSLITLSYHRLFEKSIDTAELLCHNLSTVVIVFYKYFDIIKLMIDSYQAQVDELNSTVFCKLAPSEIHGVGVIAIRSIKKGTRITNHSIDFNFFKEYHLTEKYFTKIKKPIRNLILDRMMFSKQNEKMFWFYSPNSESCLRSFMNHSENPNSNGIYTLRDIKRGEEVTENFVTMCHYRHHKFTEKHLKESKILK